MKKFFSVMFIAVLLLTMMPSVVTAPAEAAAKTIKITWNYNGGKIGKDTKTTTTVKVGTKIGKLPKTPTYTGYTFKGWYTKKTGGTKVTISTKPAKDVTYYAQWKKGESVNQNIDSKLIGWWNFWGSSLSDHYEYFFYTDGSFKYFDSNETIGKYRTSNGKVYFSELYRVNAQGERIPYNDVAFEYNIGNDNLGEYLLICRAGYLEENRDLSGAIKFRRQ